MNNSNHTCSSSFANKFHLIKRNSIKWEKYKRRQNDLDLAKIELEISHLEDPNNSGFSSDDAKYHLIKLESNRLKILKFMEETWRLKGRVKSRG